MNDKHTYLLLEIVINNGNVKRLIHEGLSFSQIADLTSNAIELQFIEYNNDKIVLTDLGRSIFEKIKDDYREKDKENWIDKEQESKIDKVDKDFIYLPNQKELFF